MKKSIGVAVIVILVGFFTVFVTGCAKNPQPLPSPAEEILKGEHKLRKMTERIESDSRVTASFFLIVGDLSATSTSRVLVKFAWQMNDGIYAISSLPLEKFRVKIDEKAETPTIKFRWGPGYEKEIQKLMDNHVIYALLTVRERDWPVSIQLPLNK